MEQLVKSGLVGFDGGIGMFPFGVIELVGQEFEFDQGFALGMEVAAGVAAQDFDLVVQAFGQVCGADVLAEALGIFHESQVLVGAFFEVFDIGFVFWA